MGLHALAQIVVKRQNGFLFADSTKGSCERFVQSAFCTMMTTILCKESMVIFLGKLAMVGYLSALCEKSVSVSRLMSLVPCSAVTVTEKMKMEVNVF